MVSPNTTLSHIALTSISCFRFSVHNYVFTFCINSYFTYCVVSENSLMYEEIYQSAMKLLEKNYNENVVYLFQFPGTPYAPSVSPYCIKVEAFCRLHDLKFERRNTFSERGQNNKVPFIELNGEQYCDSQIIIRRLIQIFNLKVYDDEQTAGIGHAIDRMLDNHTSGLLMIAKKADVENILTTITADKVPSVFLPLVTSLGGWYGAKQMGKRAAASIGSFTESEYNELLSNDLTQLQNILGNKPFLLGDVPTVADCTALGQFGSACAFDNARFYLHELLDSSEFAPLKEYIERVKTRIFGAEFCDSK